MIQAKQRHIVSLICLLLLASRASACAGSCQDSSLACPNPYISGICPGSSSMKCCPQPTPNCPGQCQDSSLPCGSSQGASGYKSGLCPGDSSIQCCVADCYCMNSMCTNPSQTGAYYLTSFCDQTVSCGSWSGNCNDYFAADYYRFGCGSIITATCSNGKSANLKIIDGGPNCYVEQDAGGPVIDASPSMCSLCTGSTSCGWSDHIKINVTWSYSSYHDDEVDEAWLDAQLGPCAMTAAEAKQQRLPMCLGEPSLVAPPKGRVLHFPKGELFTVP